MIHGFIQFLGFLPHFVVAKLATTSIIRVNLLGRGGQVEALDWALLLFHKLHPLRPDEERLL